MTRRDWREVVAEAKAKLDDPNVPEETKAIIRDRLEQLEVARIGTLAALDQASAGWEEFCRRYGL